MSKYYVPQFAVDAVKEIRRREYSSDESLEDSELEEIINNCFKQSICDFCETRMLFDDREKVAKELYRALDDIICYVNNQNDNAYFENPLVKNSIDIAIKYKNIK